MKTLKSQPFGLTFRLYKQKWIYGSQYKDPKENYKPIAERG
jgi:hypothetical protein